MTVYEIGLIAGLISIFLNYCIGKPGSEFSPYEIFSFYTVWLSINRLKKVGLIDQYHRQFEENVNRMEKESDIIELRNDYHKVLYSAAEPFFTWERAIGMCSICTGFWISLLFGLIFTYDILELVEIIVISHITIRIVNKIL